MNFLRGVGSFGIEFSSAGAGANVSTTLAVPEADENKKLKVSFDSKALGTYSTGQLQVVIEDAGSTELLRTDIPAGQGLFQATFDSNTAGNYTLKIENPTGVDMTAANSIVFDNVIVGPGRTVSGAIIGEWESWTPDWINTPPTFSSSAFYKRRVGNTYEFKGTAIASVAGSGNMGFALPDSLTLDTALTNTGGVTEGDYGDLGFGTWHNDAAGKEPNMLMPYAPSTTTIQFSNMGASTQSVLAWSSFLVAHAFGFSVSVPIAEWAGSGTLNVGQNEVEYAASAGTWDSADTDYTNTVHGSQGAPITGALSAIRTKKVEFRTPIKPTDTIRLEILQNDRWVPVGTHVEFDEYHKQNATAYGAGFSTNVAFTADGQIDVLFAQYSRANGAYAAAGDAWNSHGEAWRLVKHSAGIPVGFSLATADQAGLVPSYSEESKAADGDFSAGNVYFARVGNVVTVTAEVLTHTSTALADSSVGFVPERYRPNASTYNSYAYDQNNGFNVKIEADGKFSTFYRDETGNVSRTTTATAFSITYIVY